MKISLTNLRMQKGSSRLLATASLLMDDFAVHDIKILRGKNGEGTYIVAFPFFIDKKGMYRSIVHPTTKKLRKDIEEIILSAFLIELKKQKENDK